MAAFIASFIGLLEPRLGFVALGSMSFAILMGWV
jgi:hypothetical protein